MKRLAIGTVQFGLDYGISNIVGKTTWDDVTGILEKSRKSGVDTLDTAPLYGDSEQILGQVGVQDWKIITKIPPLPNCEVDGSDWVLEHICHSRHKLRVDRLEGVLLHNAGDLIGVQGKNIAAGLKEAKVQGLVRKVGYSIYSPHSLYNLVEVLSPDLVQAPFNVLDQRLERSGWLKRLVGMGAEVHIRSVFMQGLLLMAPEKRPPAFDKWRDHWLKWDASVGGSGEQALALCLGFVKAYTDISRIVVGLNSQAQLEQLFELWDKVAPFEADGLACDDPKLVEPSNW